MRKKQDRLSARDGGGRIRREYLFFPPSNLSETECALYPCGILSFLVEKKTDMNHLERELPNHVQGALGPLPTILDKTSGWFITGLQECRAARALVD